MNLYYLGPKGTFSYLAAHQHYSDQTVHFKPCANLYEVIQAVSQDTTSIAVVPIENAIEGTINIVADVLAEQNVFAVGEIYLDIQFALYGLKGSTLDQLKRVYSIAPAISQTHHFIHNHGLSYAYAESTIQSFDYINEMTGAIAPLGSGERLGFDALATDIQDYPHNATRFLVVTSESQHVEDATDTLLLIEPKYDKAGVLASILNTFALFNINLSWVESRPLKTQLGMYRFFVQASSPQNVYLNKALSILETLDFDVKLIGSFTQLT
ncbi:prephenate dehydratase [Staphylococcus auricularis]|uniref:Prephenate dehydratase n=1 Tax=Staphylococcus auricularis TaxID=29379 RepID=A0ABX5ICG9_9STAP|nr:prephenate dehydratase domain-containing protein [Staphylococcus auricularis]MCE5039107.1 prephenate dehydratase [Staphylococcus auricularis]MEB6570890.1 prephenate dehydratase [Staphylococcus auricularis]PTH13698.1 prephenate dehydratase [Staphylococcus auricularis]PTH26115.1 prephenate dehydratase [Staphylococcus auricularis]